MPSWFGKLGRSVSSVGVMKPFRFSIKESNNFFGVLDSLDFRHIGAIALKWRRESLIEALAPSLGLFPEQRAVSRRRFESISIDAVLVRLRQRDSDRHIARD